MKLAIDSYCYHRYFGEWYSSLQTDPGSRMTVWDFLERAHALGVTGVSLEACFLPDVDDAFVSQLRDRLTQYGLEPVWAWGHPNGFGSGANPENAADLIAHLDIARRAGAKVMRICAGGRRTRPASWPEHKAALIPILQRLLPYAEGQGVVMAVENHIDLLADEMVELMKTIDSPWLRVCLDTANNLRMLEEPLVVAEKLAPFVAATDIKDVTSTRGNPRDFANWPSVPLGNGLINISEALNLLRKANYQGLLALEIDYLDPRYDGDEENAIGVSIDYLRSLLIAERAEMILYIARHGETDLNIDDRYQGISDPPLNERGMPQAVALAASLPAGIPLCQTTCRVSFTN